MQKVFLEKPTLERKQEAFDYIKEFEIDGSFPNGSGGITRFMGDYEGWLAKLDTYEHMQPTESLVPAVEFFGIDDKNKIVGMVNIRLVLNEELKNGSGHIGYSVRPTERKKGYAKAILYEALKVCDEHNISEALASCYESNIASEKTIIALGGKLIKTVQKEDEPLKIFTIDVKQSLIKYASQYDNPTKA